MYDKTLQLQYVGLLRCKNVLCFCCYLGPKNRQRFLCEVRVDGFSYVGAGNSGNKKDAQANAVKDFVQYLVRQGKIPASQVPVEVCMFEQFFKVY